METTIVILLALAIISGAVYVLFIKKDEKNPTSGSGGGGGIGSYPYDNQEVKDKNDKIEQMQE